MINKYCICVHQLNDQIRKTNLTRQMVKTYAYITYSAQVNTADDMATCEVSVSLPEIEVFFPFALLLNLNCLP
jgi:hypothetical protein